MKGLVNLREIRNQKGVTLLRLSEITQLSSGYIADLERGDKTNPSMETILKLSNALGVSISELLDESKAI